RPSRPVTSVMLTSLIICQSRRKFHTCIRSAATSRPTDVRKGLPFRFKFKLLPMGYAPPFSGRSLSNKKSEPRKAAGFPHIGRHSRATGQAPLPSVSDSEALARVTSPAILKIQITAEDSFAVMTSGAGVVSVGKVFQSPWRTNLSFLRQSRSKAVAI
ncbi:MAG: hypothetical protein QOG23_3811, partial [Blastocatellia bacterium]|nr:hypothetical protein [Blastocatellia bacterium]